MNCKLLIKLLIINATPNFTYPPVHMKCKKTTVHSNPILITKKRTFHDLILAYPILYINPCIYTTLAAAIYFLHGSTNILKQQKHNISTISTCVSAAELFRKCGPAGKEPLLPARRYSSLWSSAAPQTAQRLRASGTESLRTALDSTLAGRRPA